MQLRRIHIALLLSAFLGGGGALYAGENRTLESETRYRDQVVIGALSSFAALQFEIDFVDSQLNRAARVLDRPGISGRLAEVPEGRAAAIDRAPSGKSKADPKFWVRFDALAGQQMALAASEDRILSGSVSSIIERRNEIRAASPLRDVRTGAGGGGNSAARTAGCDAMPEVVTVSELSPRGPGAAVAKPASARRAEDVRAGLHLHALRNGSLSGGAASHLKLSSAAARIPLHPVSLFPTHRSHSFRPNLSPSGYSTLSSYNRARVASCSAVVARLFGPELRRGFFEIAAFAIHCQFPGVSL